MELLEGKYFRVVHFADKLWIERVTTTLSYPVSFIESVDSVESKCNNLVTMLSENMSMEDFWEMMQEYRNCVEFAHSMLYDILEGKTSAN